MFLVPQLKVSTPTTWLSLPTQLCLGFSDRLSLAPSDLLLIMMSAVTSLEILQYFLVLFYLTHTFVNSSF